jgi:hypothetical protein
MADKPTAIKQIENTILDCENKILEIEKRKQAIFYKIKSSGGDLSRDYTKQLSGLNAEKKILEELAESSRKDLAILDLLRPLVNETRPELEKRAKEIDKFLAANDVLEIIRKSLKAYKNQLISEARFTAQPEPRKEKVKNG